MAKRKHSGTEILYNGIVLPTEWPPNYGHWERNPMPVPYLENPPEVIPIDVGRQLFVDDFLVQDSTLKRVFHSPEYYQANPIVRPDRPWEQQEARPMAMVFSDGVWYDPQDGLLKMWYMAGGTGRRPRLTCYATSRDGIHWDKPPLDVFPGTNIVIDGPGESATVWLDLQTDNPRQRFKYNRVYHGDQKWFGAFHVSPDGIHWSQTIAEGTSIGDRATFFYNPFRKVWVCSGKGNEWMGDHWFRMRLYKEAADWITPWQWQMDHTELAKGDWAPGEPVVWVSADKLDPRHPWPEYADAERQLYNLDALAYESLMLGFFTIWQGPENRECARLGIQKQNQVFLGFSRDGFHWDRPDRRPILPTDINNPDAWNRGNVQSAAGGCLVVGDRLYLYCSGRAYGKPEDGDSTGLAFLRRDGFASLDADAGGGTLTTRPITFAGKHLFVNVNADGGELRAEVLAKDGQAIPGYRAAECRPVSVDKTAQQVTWQAGKDLAALSGQPVRFQFYLKNGALYAFWVSPDASGASHGYVGAGGPGFRGPTDTVGSGA